MPHPLTIPEKTLYVDLGEFHGRAVLAADDTPDLDNSYWGVNYAEFASEEDAHAYRNPLRHFGRITVSGALLGAYMIDPAYNGGKGDFVMRRAENVGPLLAKLFGGSFTESEWACIIQGQEDLRKFRAEMSAKGLAMFAGAVPVTELEVTPDE